MTRELQVFTILKRTDLLDNKSFSTDTDQEKSMSNLNGEYQQLNSHRYSKDKSLKSFFYINGVRHLKKNYKIQKGPWDFKQDQALIRLVKMYGPKNWSKIARQIQGRIGKQCRERWYNHLSPNIKKDKWNEDEDQIIIKYHQIYGNRWSLIAKHLQGRTDNSVKNHWNSTIKRKFKLQSELQQSQTTIKGNKQETCDIKPRSLIKEFEVGDKENYQNQSLESQNLLRKLQSYFQ